MNTSFYVNQVNVSYFDEPKVLKIGEWFIWSNQRIYLIHVLTQYQIKFQICCDPGIRCQSRARCTGDGRRTGRQDILCRHHIPFVRSVYKVSRRVDAQKAGGIQECCCIPMQITNLSGKRLQISWSNRRWSKRWSRVLERRNNAVCSEQRGLVCCHVMSQV